MEPAVQWRGDLRRRRGAAARRPGCSSPVGRRPRGSPGRLSIRTPISQETTMTASATPPTREEAERAREDREYVRSLLNVRQPQFAAALEAAARKLLRDHRMVCASSQRSSQPGWGLLAAAGRPAALPAGRVCELRVGPEFFYLGSEAGALTVRRGPAPDGDAVVTMPAGTLFGLLTGQVTVTGAVRAAAVEGGPEIARRALEPLAGAGARPAPSPAPDPARS